MSNPVVGQQINMPPKPTPAEEPDGSLAYVYYRLLRALFDRTGGGSGIPILPPASVVGAGAGQANGAKLMPGVNFVTATGDCVMPASLRAGNFLVVVDVTPSAALKVFPAPGIQIDALGANNAYTMNPGGAVAFATVQLFWFQTALQCYATKLG